MAHPTLEMDRLLSPRGSPGMIEVRGKEGGYDFEVWTEPPCIYLDHWALRRLSEDDAQGDRFISALKQRGTLMFSVMNVAEIGADASHRRSQQVRDFLRRIGLRWFPMTIDPLRVIRAEEEDAPSGKLHCASPEFLTDPAFAAKLLCGPLSLAHVIDLTAGRGGDCLRRVTECKTTQLLEELQRWRSLYRQEPEALDAQYPPLKFNANTPMRGIYNGLVRYTIKDTFPLDLNHMRDFCHATVSLRCADMVTLDSHWAAQAKKLHLPDGFVKVYSEPDLSNFLSHLEAASATS